MSHFLLCVARKEDLAADLALDCVSPWVARSVVKESKPLIAVLSVGDTMLPDVGLYSVARENRTLAGVADETETKPLGRDEEGRGHCREMV